MALAASRGIFRLAGVGARPFLASRGLFTGRASLVGVEPKDEAIYSDEHWEMRQVSDRLLVVSWLVGVLEAWGMGSNRNNGT